MRITELWKTGGKRILSSNLAGSLAVVKLLGQKFNPLQHGGLEGADQEGYK